MYDISTIITKLPILRKYYDCVRVLDPFEKKVLSLHALNEHEHQKCDIDACYAFWKNGGSCKNCISQKAAAENSTFVKIEVAGEKIYMVTALPIIYENNKYVLELIKDVTNKTDFLNAIDSFSGEINQKVLQEELLQFTKRLL